MNRLDVQDEHSLHYPGWRVVAASAGCVFFSFASLLVYTFGIFLKPVAAQFHWTREAISLAMGLAAMGVAACSPFIGALLDRVSARRIIIPCFLVFWFSLYIAGFSDASSVAFKRGLPGFGSCRQRYGASRIFARHLHLVQLRTDSEF